MPVTLDSLAAGFMPHGYCLRWDAPLLVFFISANAGIALAYFAIPLALRYFIGQRKDLPYPHMFKLFAAFILSCGITHLAKIVTIWYPAYWAEALIDTWTAAVSLLTAILLFPLIPQALALRSPVSIEQANEKLVAANEELKTLNAELSRANEALLVARDQALESSTLKSAFIANVSHELRTPLSGVLGMNELLLTTDLSADQLMMANTVRDSARTLLSLVNDILDLSKIEAGKMSIETIPMTPGEVVVDAVGLLAVAAQTREVELKMELAEDLPPKVLGDPVRTHQILLNLIGNAVKFTHKGTVTVKVTSIEKTDKMQMVLFEVTDTGIGISKEQGAMLFMPFIQADMSTTRKYGGTGLGLTISKRLVELMGGEIGYESELHKGSHFWFKIPYMNVEQCLEPLVAEGLTNVFAGRRPILVVEDNFTMQELVAMQLTSMGAKYRIVGSAEEGLAELSRARYGAILMDCNLPGMDGFEAARRIRENEAGTNEKIPIIAMTAATMKGDEQRCMTAGMQDFLSKPYTLEQMKQKLEKWLPPM